MLAFAPAHSNDSNNHRAGRKITPLESIESPFVSQDPVQHQAAIDFYTEAYKLQRSKQKHSLHGPLIHINLPNSSDVAKYCPLLATAMLLLAGALLLAPQQGLQLLAGVLHGPPAAHDAVGCCFAQLMGAGYLFQAVVTTLAWVRITDCHMRMQWPLKQYCFKTLVFVMDAAPCHPHVQPAAYWLCEGSSAERTLAASIKCVLQ